jgi:transcriptional regulator with XRE-family HTH domain
MTMMTATELRRIRKRLKLSQSQLAALLGIHTNSIARSESRKSPMPIREPLARLIIVAAHLHDVGDDFLVQLAGRRRR